MIVLKHKDPNVYIIHPLCGGPVHTVNQWQLFDLKKSSLGDSGDLDLDPTIPSAPETKLPFFQLKKTKTDLDRPHNHPYGTSSKPRLKLYFKCLNSMKRTGKRQLGGGHLQACSHPGCDAS